MNAELLPTSRAVSNQTDNSDYRKLAIHLTDTKETIISVACIPLKNGETKPARIPSLTAISEWKPRTVQGDVNADGTFNISDAVLMQKWLLAVPATELKDWRSGDLDGNGKLNATDLCHMKRELLRSEAK